MTDKEMEDRFFFRSKNWSETFLKRREMEITTGVGCKWRKQT